MTSKDVISFPQRDRELVELGLLQLTIGLYSAGSSGSREKYLSALAPAPCFAGRIQYTGSHYWIDQGYPFRPRLRQAFCS